ncbi:RelA/SpoT family protein [Pseudaquabacterium rugosum]|uniref:GTP pyrophosphokinase n=1 Tax=Pseudaquabacterium rugosum TaxID=2984194 RepID=A0ABU9B521_9BURK
MKTGSTTLGGHPAAIVQAVGVRLPATPAHGHGPAGGPTTPAGATSDSPVPDAGPLPAGAPSAGASADDEGIRLLSRAQAFALPLLQGQPLDTGEDAAEHAAGVAAILLGIGAAPDMAAAAWLVYAGDHLHKPEEVIARAFGEGYAGLVSHTRKLVQIQRAAREARLEAEARAQQVERVRKMLLAFSRDLRVVLLRLASRLQTLRWYAASKTPCPLLLARETQEVFAPLANRLGIWQIKWELEDLAFRFLQPDDYKAVARALAERRIERESGIESTRAALAALLAEADIPAEVQGRPKHLYSIWKKMRGKNLGLERIFDVRALRVIVADVPACYGVLATLHSHWNPLPGEYDDYIARPKPNGYQSLHSVVAGPDGRPVEVQIRTAAMHDHAEHGVAAHWAYKEAGTRGYAGVSAAGEFEERVAEARKAVLRQLLAWERDYVRSARAGAGTAEAPVADDAPGGAPSPAASVGAPGESAPPRRAAAAAEDPLGTFDDRIYVFTPQSTVIDLVVDATPVDFAYAVHTDLGHRCRGARIDGQMVPLNTVLANGQTVEIISVREGGPSLDWLNTELGYLNSPRARAKVRAWFNARAQQATIARGREAVEKVLQREGRTAMRLEDLAAQLGFRSADALFEIVGKDEYPLRPIELLLRPPAAPVAEPGDVAGADSLAGREAAAMALKRARAGDGRGGVLVVGVDSLLTQLARCCRPAPPDAIGGYVTRGKGVAVHRCNCPNFVHMSSQQPDRVIDVAWGERPADRDAVYPVDVLVEAGDRTGLLRDISELFSKERMNVIAVHTQSLRSATGRTAFMTFTVELADAARLPAVLRHVQSVPGVRQVRRR